MAFEEYHSVDVVIRSFGYSPLLSTTIQSLLSQEGILCNFIIVNSCASNHGLSTLSSDLVVIPYIAPKFNYSESINVAIPSLKSEFTLVISSHTSILNSLALRYAVSILSSNYLVAAVNFSDSSDGSLSYNSVDARSFDGWNGTWNTASLYRTQLLRSRPFRTDVLSAEDQEWSRWAVEIMGMDICHITGSCTVNANPRKYSVAKRLKEWEFISAFAYPSYLSINFIATKLRSSAGLLARLRIKDSIFELMVAFVLIRVKLFGVYSDNSSY